MRRLVIGDIHGNLKALYQCFERSNFDYENDLLISLGDVCDGFPFVKQCIDELLKIKNIRFIMGNHDFWTLEWMQIGLERLEWYTQGGKETKLSYGQWADVPYEHKKFLREALPYYQLDNKLFVHGGFKPECPIEKQSLEELTWNRQLIESAFHKHFRNPNYKFSRYDEIFLGHTTTQAFWKKRPEKQMLPIHCCNVWNIDTGAGWDGKLTIMDIDTKEYWQSDLPSELYVNDSIIKGIY